MTLTKRQKDIMDAIEVLTLENGYTPSYREVASRAGYNSGAAIYRHLKELESKGYLIKIGNKRCLAISGKYRQEWPKAIA